MILQKLQHRKRVAFFTVASLLLASAISLDHRHEADYHSNLQQIQAEQEGGRAFLDCHFLHQFEKRQAILADCNLLPASQETTLQRFYTNQVAAKQLQISHKSRAPPMQQEWAGAPSPSSIYQGR